VKSDDYNLPVGVRLDRQVTCSSNEDAIQLEGNPRQRALSGASGLDDEDESAIQKDFATLKERKSSQDYSLRPTVHGAWFESANNKQYCHVIEDSSLRFGSSFPATSLDITPIGTSFIMFLEGACFMAVLDQSGQTLCWSDGEVWTRANLDGHWVDEAGASYVIKGTSMIAPDETEPRFLDVSNSSPPSCTMHVRTATGSHSTKAEMAPCGKFLNWSSGEKWARKPGIEAERGRAKFHSEGSFTKESYARLGRSRSF
jgi:hypothetical protein